MADLLLELFSEEIPARMQARAADDLKRLVTDGLVEAGITYESATAHVTPRRLCLSLTGLPAKAPDLREERRGPRVGAPDKAVEGFLRGVGLTRDQLEVRDDKKGQVYFAVIERPGRAAGEVAADVITKAIRNFPWPKSMRWGSGSLRWVRPLHSILCILVGEEGASPVAIDIDGIPCGNTTEGHRFMAPGRFSVVSFDDYAAKLRERFVMLDAEERRDHISSQAANLAFAQNMELVQDKGLLAELAGLVEWPVVLMGDIAPDFLDLPPEVLQTSMREHQKFFSVRNPSSGRIEKFITVANRETADHGAAILAGNQKVLFARLSDAKFFWENDLRIAKTDISEWTRKLENVTFHNRIGSQGARITQIRKIARILAHELFPDLSQGDVEYAAEMAKADLSSEMVYEFPELQGVMGRYYLLAAGKSPDIAYAAEEHYRPLGPEDSVPVRPVSICVALADKGFSLGSFWGFDEKPTGSKDPFALRRACLGAIRIVLENDLRLSIRDLFDSAIQRAVEIRAAAEDEFRSMNDEERKEAVQDRSDNLLSFFHDRLKVHLRARGIRHDVIDACLAMPGNDDLVLLVKRAEALGEFLKTDDGENLLQGFRRANNILRQAEEKDGVSYEGAPDVKYAVDDSERALFAALDNAEATILPALEAEDFAAAMSAMAALRAPIDAFFESVQVNTDNAIVRRNRLCLLNRIREVMGRVARFDVIEG